MNPKKQSQGELESLLSSLAFAAGFEPVKIDLDRGVWILTVNTILAQQLEIFSQSLENHDLKHVAVEFSK